MFNVVDYVCSELDKMGCFGVSEKVMLGIFVLLLLLWVNVLVMLLGVVFMFDFMVVVFVGLFVFIIIGMIDWDDVFLEKSVWDMLVWFGVLVMLVE